MIKSPKRPSWELKKVKLSGITWKEPSLLGIKQILATRSFETKVYVCEHLQLFSKERAPVIDLKFI